MKCVFNWVCACEIVKCSTIMCVHVKSVFKHVCVFVYVSVSENMCVCLIVCVRKCVHVKGSVCKGIYVFKHVKVGKSMCVCMCISSYMPCVQGCACVHACLCPLLLLLSPPAKPN